MVNLLVDKCLPVIRADGGRDRICFAQLVETENPPVAFDCPRGDFTASLTVFSIGVLQTVMSPKGDGGWARFFTSPPNIETLRERLAPIAPFFELETESGPAFMQDLERDVTGWAENEISGLLPDQPGGNTLKENKDIFNKREKIKRICSVCASISLYNLASCAPSGGVGHRVSLRGGGPLSTLVLGDTLWQTIWLGVVPFDVLEDGMASYEGGDPEPEAFFAWALPTQTSEKRGKVVPAILPGEVHPLHVYWSMPRRIRLAPAVSESGTCDLCRGEAEAFYTHYHTKNYGNNYSGNWYHPLTPSLTNKDNTISTLKGQPGGLRYRHWIVWTMANHTTGKEAAKAVTAAWGKEARLRKAFGSENARRIWVFGYDMDNMKARRWLDGTAPLYNIGDLGQEKIVLFQERVQGLVEAANYVVGQLVAALKKLVTDNPKKKVGNFDSERERFWSDTEPAFYKALAELVLDPGAEEPALRFGLVLHQHAKDAITAHRDFYPIESDIKDLDVLVKTYDEVCKYTHPNGKKLSQLLGITRKENPKKKQEEKG